MSSIQQKVALIGDTNVGKTSLAERISKNRFITEYSPTIGSSTYTINQKTNGQPLNYILWDTAGQEKYRSLIPSYTRDASIILLVFDLTNSKYLESINAWYQNLKEILNTNQYVIIVGNKCDLEYQIDFNKIQEICDEISNNMGPNIPKSQCILTSAKENLNIDDLLTLIGEGLIKMSKQKPQEAQNVQNINVKNSDSPKKKCC